jgi:predicted 3-demethylubiquinone-9 3-methyltransferase (glyoxalase superfamily)
MNKITPCLWFNGNAEAAANFYISVFQHSKILAISRYGEGAPMPSGTALMVRFSLDGVEHLALNGGPHFTFNPAISLVAHCETQAEVDDLWEKLVHGGAPSQCGWLTDQFGVSWQIVPRCVSEMMLDTHEPRRQRVMHALMQMAKLDIATLQRAYDAA